MFRILLPAILSARIDTISKQILSRTNLEKIINQFNLFMEPDQENLHLEEKIAYCAIV